MNFSIFMTTRSSVSLLELIYLSVWKELFCLFKDATLFYCLLNYNSFAHKHFSLSQDSTRKIETYDEATQAKLRKLLFDENQLRQGLPTSDEILGVKPDIPQLPKGVEYLDSSTLDKIATKK